MGSKAVARAVLLSALLVTSGVAGSFAWRYGLWGTLTGATLTALWCCAYFNWAFSRERAIVGDLAAEAPEDAGHGLLLDASPAPILAIEASTARTLNRAARTLFRTDDRIVPAPSMLLDPIANHLRYAGRAWRIDRVTLPGVGRMVVTLVDIEKEEQAAEARVTSELMQVLGHELLNGLTPITSLAESGKLAIEASSIDLPLLRDIFGTLARHVEGLQRFTHGYRQLARLPEPSVQMVSIDQLTNDLARLFEGRWPDIELVANVEDDLSWPIDRDQVSQAVWALMQNAAEAGDPDNPLRLRVRLSASRAENGLAIEVEDNGVGISPDMEMAIFRLFHTTKPGGLGIGLSLARQIANAHGGALTQITCSPTTFRLFFPARDASFPLPALSR